MIEPLDGPGASSGATRVRRVVLADIEDHARADAPHECCGLLLGADGYVQASHRARNELASATRYRIHPEDHFAAIRAARAARIEVIGAYHSHPASEPVPSARDSDEADHGFLYLIAGIDASGRTVIRGWRLQDGNFVPVPLVTVQ